MSLNKILKIKERSKKRVGRGIGSGKGGHTSGKGQKGQKSRAGHQFKPNFAGGQNPLGRGLPVRKGFGNPAISKKIGIRVEKLNRFEGEITLEILRKEFKIDKDINVKIVAGGELKKKLKNIDVPMTTSVALLFK